MRKILSIVPAPPGWFSTFTGGDLGNIHMPIAVWALVNDVDENGKLIDDPYVIGLAPCDSDKALYPEIEDNLGGYVYRPDLQPPDFAEPEKS